MSLIELVVAFVVLMIVLVPISLLLTNVVAQSSTSRQKLTALSLAEKCIEKLSNTGPTLSQGVPETGVSILENTHCFGSSALAESTVTYNVHAEFTWQTAQGSHPDLCTSSVTATLIEAEVWTTWGHTQRVTDTAILDYPPPSLPTDGFIAVVVNGTPAGSPPTDASGRTWATRVQLVPVTISRTGFSVTLYPNSYGCVFEEVPAPDSYTVTAASPTSSPKWVSTSEGSTTSTTVTANLDTVTHVTLQYDEGTLVSLHYPSSTATEGPVACPGAGQVQCVVFGQAPASTAAPAKSPYAEISVLAKSTGKWSVTALTGANDSAARLIALGCAGTNQCIAVGFGGSAGSYVGASLSSGTSSTPSFVNDTVPSGVTSLSGISCPTSTRCFAWGVSSSGGVILTGTITSNSVSWGSSADTLATVPARVTSIACWAKTHCYALGTKKTATTPVVLSLSATTSRTWTNDTLPTTTTYAPQTLTQLTCPATTTCYAVGTRKTSHGEALSLSTTTSRKWTKDTVPTTVTALALVVCPAKTVCYATGTRKTGTTSYGAIISLTTSTTWKVDTPKTAKSISAITCPSTSACLALGTSSSGTPALFWRTAAAVFTSESIPSTVTMLSAISCANSTHCFAIGAAASSGSTYGTVLSGSSSWTADSLPSSPVAVSFSGVGCAQTTCVAPGASETAAVYFDGKPTGTGWTSAAVSGAQGMYVGGVPIAVTNSSLTTDPMEVTVPSGTTPSTQVGPLFPFSSGYGIAASECKPLPASESVTATPGQTVSTTVPMGMISIRAANKYGNPDTGATISASLVTSTGCTELSPPTGKTNPASFTLEPTGPLGYSQVDLPYGTYKITVTHSTHTGTITKLTVSATSVSVTTGSAQATWSPLAVTVT